MFTFEQYPDLYDRIRCLPTGRYLCNDVYIHVVYNDNYYDEYINVYINDIKYTLLPDSIIFEEDTNYAWSKFWNGRLYRWCGKADWCACDDARKVSQLFTQLNILSIGTHFRLLTAISERPSYLERKEYYDEYYGYLD